MSSPDPQLSIHDRQRKVPGHDLNRLASARIRFVGAGGLATPIVRGLARKGAGSIAVCDPDEVDVTNLARQDLFLESDIGIPKVWALIQNLAPHCTMACELVGDHGRLEDLLVVGEDFSRDSVLVVGVDNGDARRCAAQLGWRLGIPVVLTATDLQAEYGYVLIQHSRPGTPCFCCKFPEYQEPAPCGIASSPDILNVLAGLALRAIDAALGMPIALNWNYREIHLNGWMEDTCATVAPQPNCPLCGKLPCGAPLQTQAQHA
jgi:molybdopterin/thiamine biosynthesis adenylyltransferase